MRYGIFYGECSDCGWMCEYPQSHIEYSRTHECEYLLNLQSREFIISRL